MDLEKITDPSFLKELDIRQLNQLADDIRKFLINNISKTGGHLSSNLGVVELSIALHYVFNSPKDKIFFDVGHQSYVHKILTGRAVHFFNAFESLKVPYIDVLVNFLHYANIRDFQAFKSVVKVNMTLGKLVIPQLH